MIEVETQKTSIWQSILLHKTAIVIFEGLSDGRKGLSGEVPMQSLTGCPIVRSHSLCTEGERHDRTSVRPDYKNWCRE